jgi:hypothetical protein
MLSRSSEDGALRTLPLSYEDGHELDQNEKIPPQVKRGENRNERRRKCCPKGDIPQNKINATDKFNEASNRKQDARPEHGKDGDENQTGNVTLANGPVQCLQVANFAAKNQRLVQTGYVVCLLDETQRLRRDGCGGQRARSARTAKEAVLWKCMILEDDRNIPLSETTLLEETKTSGTTLQ